MEKWVWERSPLCHNRFALQNTTRFAVGAGRVERMGIDLNKAHKVLCFFLAVIMVFSLTTCTARAPEALPPLTDYRQVPSITAAEIDAIEALKAQYESFVFAMMPPNTELFYDENGEVRGYSALLCEWLTALFGIRFEPAFFDWPDILAGLGDLSIDFTGELTATPERRKYLFMTESIGERTIKAIRYAGSRMVSESTAESPIRCCFLAGTTAYDCVAPYISNIEVVYANSVSEVKALFAADKIDAFVVDGTAEASFDTDIGVIAEEFAPMIYSPVSLTTQNPALTPVIDVVQRILDSEYNHLFSDMYKQGYNDYLRRKLVLQLTPEEKAFIAAHAEAGLAIPYAAKYDNYPVSFFNTHDDEWQGISFDILNEIGLLTGLTFIPANDPGVAWEDLMPLLKSGAVPMSNELIYSAERAEQFLWADVPYLTDYLALVSASKYTDVDVSRLAHTSVGLIAESAYASFFYDRFPEHKDYVVYPDLFMAVAGLERGDVDLLMSTKNTLLNITNYLEKPSFKANMIFMRAAESYFGFHTEEALLCSIISKAQSLVNTHSITDYWQRMVFDYTGALEREQMPLRIGFTVMVILIMLLLVILVIWSRHAGVALEATVRERTKELEIQTKTTREILDLNPFNSVLFDEDANILDCNLSAINFFGLAGVEDKSAKLAAEIAKMIPPSQPDGRRSTTYMDRVNAAFADGYADFETCFIVDGKPMTVDIIMKRVLYQDKRAVITYMIDLTAQKEIQNSLQYHGALLEALGSVANMLLMIDAKDLDATMNAALNLIGTAASVDRAYIWKNRRDEDGKVFASQIFEWSPQVESHRDNELVLDVSMDEALPHWNEFLQRGQSIKSLAKDIPLPERERFTQRGVISVLLVPIFLQDEFWGFIGFDDCFEERAFLDIEENVLRICGFMSMVICDTIQGEVAVHLLAEREAALISAQIKSNFLANMSHEIRTPMNAIMGMTELIMHESISSTVLSHATDIRNACRGLLTILNDILDISKIESGKLEIVPQRYHIASLLIDVISIVRQRLEKKDVFFAVNIAADIPSELIGDEVRIKQILINLLVNAVKFTREGRITFDVTCVRDNEDCRLRFSVTDTGLGIKPEDREKIFVLFQQIDTKKNRNIEGTGLGLSISRQLAEMMDGCIEMESEYGVGSTFTAEIKQAVANGTPVAALKHPERASVLIYESRPMILQSVTDTLDSLGCKYTLCANRTEMHSALENNHFDYIFLSSLSVGMAQEMIAQKKRRAVIVVLDGDGTPYSRSNVISLTMPIHCLQIANIFNDEATGYTTRIDSVQAAKIHAPNAKVLVVDDNAVNLKVATGLLKTYGILADNALSGRRALDMVQEKEYDLVFMDHMMPEMDGIDATVAIRKLGGLYETLPIVALTANAVSGMKEMFMAEGLNDFLPKPMESSKLNAILRKWLPAHVQQENDGEADA